MSQCVSQIPASCPSLDVAPSAHYTSIPVSTSFENLCRFFAGVRSWLVQVSVIGMPPLNISLDESEWRAFNDEGGDFSVVNERYFSCAKRGFELAFNRTNGIYQYIGRVAWFRTELISNSQLGVKTDPWYNTGDGYGATIEMLLLAFISGESQCNAGTNNEDGFYDGFTERGEWDFFNFTIPYLSLGNSASFSVSPIGGFWPYEPTSGGAPIFNVGNGKRTANPNVVID